MLVVVALLAVAAMSGGSADAEHWRAEGSTREVLKADAIPACFGRRLGLRG